MKNSVNIPFWRISFANGEGNAASLAIQNEHISQGPVVREFERQLADYLGVPYVVATTSGSAALLMSLMAANVCPGDEVIVPNRTWIATAHAPLLLGAKVRLIDVEPHRPIIEAKLIEQMITEKTRAIMPVHLCGRAADMDLINALAKKHNLIVIEDAAQALGSKNSNGYLGTQSDMGCFSLSVTKIISTGQGGFIATKNAEHYRSLISIRTQGVGDVMNARWDRPGFNFRFTDILAAIGIEQLKQLNDRIEKVKDIYEIYKLGLHDIPGIKLIPVNIENGEIPVYVEALSNKRDELAQFLESHNIQSRPFYPSLSAAAYFKEHSMYPNSEIFARNGLYLPCGPDQRLENIQRVISLVRGFNIV